MSSLIEKHASAVANKARKSGMSPWKILSTDYNRRLSRTQKSRVNTEAKKILSTPSRPEKWVQPLLPLWEST